MAAIEVQNVKKSYRVYLDKGKTLKEKILFQSRNQYEERLVLDGVSFQVEKGEAIGLIGHNGCGKSTLLKLMTKIIYPDSGSIHIQGRISSLIELGAGFHPDMTGRENIYTNASIFGLTKKEIKSRIDQMIAFSELEDYIDNPVRTYSSGMYTRLAFSVAIHVDAEVLLIDEILAVGDAAFQAKCFGKLLDMKAQGTTIVIVSHSLQQIEQICNRSIWIEKGKVQMEDTPNKVHLEYLIDMGLKKRVLPKHSEEAKKEFSKEKDRKKEEQLQEQLQGQLQGQPATKLYKEVKESVLLKFLKDRAIVSGKEIDLEKYQKDYRERITEELNDIKSIDSRKIVLIICRNYRSSKEKEDRKKEAFEVFWLLKKVRIYLVRFISLELEQTEPLEEGEVLFLPEKNAGTYIHAIRPDLCIFFEQTPDIIRVDHCSMILNKAIFRLSGQNPLQGISQSTIEELTHLNDYSVHNYLVQSETAYQILVQNGFHEPEIWDSFSSDKSLKEEWINLIEREVGKECPATCVTLYEWDRILRLHQKSLVRGHQSLKLYDQQKERAVNDAQECFPSHAFQYLDWLERQNLCAIVEDWFSGLPIKSLDIACGDGRITQECIKYGNCIAIDTSEEMLELVNNRFQAEKNRPVTKGLDIITDPLLEQYDLITCFRYIRHLDYKTRKLFYKKIFAHLSEHGLFVMDVPNLAFELPYKIGNGWQNYTIYDVAWTKKGILEELRKNGFQVQYILPTGQGLMPQLAEDIRNLPMVWTIGARRIKKEIEEKQKKE